jgi:hypothetical protein
MLFIPTSAVETTNHLAQSALPDAPVIPDGGRRARPRLGAILRAAAQRQLRLADRLDPVPSCS